MGTFAAGQVVVLPFTCHESLPVNIAGKLKQTALQQTRTAVIGVILDC